MRLGKKGKSSDGERATFSSLKRFVGALVEKNGKIKGISDGAFCFFKETLRYVQIG